MAGEGVPQHTHGHHNKKGLRFALAVSSVLLMLELFGGLLTNSLALIADAVHMLTDVGAVGLSLFALWMAERPPTARRTFGYVRVEILAALLNGLTLLGVSAYIFWEAVQRLFAPPQVNSLPMIGVALVALFANLGSAAVLHKDHSHSLNVRAAFLHIVGDALASFAAVLAGAVILLTGWVQADPLLSAVIGVLVLVSAWRVLQEATDILLEATPRALDLDTVQMAMRAVPDVRAVHDLHIWTLTTGFIALSGHVLITPHTGAAPACADQQTLRRLQMLLAERFDISHATLQIEEDPTYDITDACCYSDTAV